MRNIRLTIAYDGTNYVGWQIQPNGPSIQAALETAIHKLTGSTSDVITSGRTDSGVHALGQVANFRTESSIPCDKIRTGLQRFLPHDIVIREAEDVEESFHATRSAIQKRYRYLIYNSAIAFPFIKNYACRFHRKLDAEAMQAGAGMLLGTHDFRCFESQFPNRLTSVRTIKEVEVKRCSIWPIWDDQSEQTPDNQGPFIRFDIVADGFLYNMVRAIVGTLMKVGEHKWTPADVKRIIEQQDRSQAGETAPAQGLYLVKVDY